MKPAAENYTPFLLRTSKGLTIINLNSIIRIEAVSNYSKLYFDTGKTMLVAKLLRWFEAELPMQQFIRVHRTHVVNKQFICNYYNGTISRIKLLNGELIEVARRKKNNFLRLIAA